MAKKGKNMEAESIDLETVLLWSEQDIKYRYKLVVTGRKIQPRQARKERSKKLEHEEHDASGKWIQCITQQLTT